MPRPSELTYRMRIPDSATAHGECLSLDEDEDDVSSSSQRALVWKSPCVPSKPLGLGGLSRLRSEFPETKCF